ncbi:MAG TPA: hypothetical protein PLP19_02595 [bacterium]|nr:hypothetical protein [bacterium]HPN42354.1 hypothetical protein [bacterium]
MSPVWENIKKTFRSSAATLKAEAENVAKTVAEKAPGVTEKMSDKAKEIAAVVADKTGEAISFSKLKVQIYNLNGDIDKAITALGARTWELYMQDQKPVFDDPDIITALNTIKNLKQQVADAELKIAELGKQEEKPGPPA